MMRLYYLGPAGSFTEEAAKNFIQEATYIPCSSIEDTLTSVKTNKAAYGIVPVENSLEGTVLRTLDLILEKNLRVIAEISMSVSQNLLSKEKTLADIKTVYSHPHAIAQSRLWLQKHLPEAELKETPSTSYAAEFVSKTPAAAAIGSLAAANLCQLNVLRSHINNHAHNLTRFWLVAKTSRSHILPMSLNRTRTKTSLYVILKDKVGALRDILDTFAKNDVSLTFIESRPLAEKPWWYGFFMDLLVDERDPFARRMLYKLRKEHLSVRVLGSYGQHGECNEGAAVAYNFKRIENIFKKNCSNARVTKSLRRALSSIDIKPPLPRYARKMLWLRFLLLPAVARYKEEHNKEVQDPIRERNLLQKTRDSAILHHLYKNIFTASRKTQREIMRLMESKKVSSKESVSLPLPDIRYYIDYIDDLILCAFQRIS